MAEWYARDTSRKIKSVIHKKGRDGKPMCTNPIYGFRKDPANKDVWLIDEEAATVVRRIFQLTIGGMGPFVIAKTLSAEKIERPSYYLWRTGALASSGKCNPDLPYNWRGNVIAKMLLKREYMGDLVNFKCSKPSFKDKKVVWNTPEDQVVFEGALPAIVSRETWELAQRLRRTRRIPKGDCPPNPLTGLLYCADCGARMSNRRSNYTEDKFGNPIPSADTYECSTYRRNAARQVEQCSIHYVRSSVVRERLLDVIRQTCAAARENEAEFIQDVRGTEAARQEETVRTYREQLAKAGRRIAELDMLLRKAFEDNVAGKLSGGRYGRISGAYEREQAELSEQMEALRAGLDTFELDNANMSRFMELTRRYTNFGELSTQMLNDFVNKVLVYSADKSSGERVQRMDVFLNYIGKIELPADELSPEEAAASEQRLAKKRRQQEYFHQRYFERKESRKKDE